MITFLSLYIVGCMLSLGIILSGISGAAELKMSYRDNKFRAIGAMFMFTMLSWVVVGATIGGILNRMDKK